ncbi:hypothetical protein SY89_02555 [Halolamina pelagica]|uniref:Uncharacterized protein n=1 Tax=Halolamina pelagica TaxID=699431 RepID=A0A0P7HXH2_9EURY|nr:hypothetical protein SY89_02555 [Halolamina pelagica]
MLAGNESLTPREAQRVLRATAVSHDGELYLDAAGAVQAVSTTERAFDDPALDWYNETVSEGGR